MVEWAKSSFEERRNALGVNYVAADDTTLTQDEYNALPDWYKSEMKKVNTSFGPRYESPDGTQLTQDEYNALPDAPPGDPEPEQPEQPGQEEPEPEAPPAVPEGLTADRLKAFMAGDGLTDDVAEISLASATALVEGYARGNHADGEGNPRPGIETVILTVAARIAANPGQISRRDSAGPFSQNRGVGFQGFTLAELSVLNRYRKRALG